MYAINSTKAQSRIAMGTPISKAYRWLNRAIALFSNVRFLPSPFNEALGGL